MGEGRGILYEICLNACIFGYTDLFNSIQSKKRKILVDINKLVLGCLRSSSPVPNTFSS